LGQLNNLDRGILEEKCHSQFRAIGLCADIKEVKTTNWKISAKQEDESKPRLPYSPDIAFSVFHIFDPPGGCTLRTLF
jgi:hypothetical protein